jgi:N4-gp56 family major capsid protein
MAATFAATNAVGTADASNFIPELWSDEVLAAYKANVVMSDLVTTLDFHGEKGDTIHVPRPTRGSVTAKANDSAVTLIAESNTAFDLSIATHYEYSRLIEDIAKIQALDSMRAFYTDDAGFALAIQVDTDLHSQGALFAASSATPTTAGAAYSQAEIGSDGATAWSQAGSGNGAALTDAGIRRAIQELDDNNVPARDRALVVPPVEKRKLMGIPRFTEQAFVGEVAGSNTIRNGLIGDIYGVPVFVSTNVATVEANDSTAYRACLLFQKESVIFAEQLAPRTQTQYKQEFLADLFTADQIYGFGTMRPEAGIALIVPNS